MKKKIRWGAIGAAVVVVGGIAVFTINERNYGKQVEAVASELSASEKMMKQIEGEISALYAEGSTQFLDAEISQETIDAVQERLTKYQETSLANHEKVAKLRKNDQKNHQVDAKNLSTLQGEMKLVQEKFNSQQAINALFQKDYLTGTDVNKDVVIVDDLTADKVTDVKKAHEKDEIDEKDEFQAAINKGFEVAESQLKQIVKAKKAVSELYKDNEVTDKATRETFDTAKKEVQAIKNEKARKSFDVALKAIEEKVKEDEAAKKEAEKQAKETKRQEEQAAANRETQATTESTERGETAPTSETPTQETNTTPNTNMPAVTQPVTPPASNGNSAGGSTNTSGSNPGNNAGGSSDGGSSTGGNSSGGSSSGGNTGGGSTTTPPPTTPTPPPVPERPHRVTPLGNSGMEFATNMEAAQWGLAQIMNPDSRWFGMRSTSKPLLWSNGEVLSYSLDFY